MASSSWLKLCLASFLCTLAFCQDSSQCTGSGRADILFVLDASGSVGREDFQKELQFAATLTNNFQVPNYQFSVIRFDTTASVIFNFNTYRDGTSLKNAILNIQYSEGGTDTAAALRLAREEAFTAIRGARPGVPKIVIVATDGQSNNPNNTLIEAKRLRDSNVLVLTIGVGSQVYKPELDGIASFSQDVFTVIDFNRLVAIVNDYSNLVCREVKLFICSRADVYFLLDSSNKINQADFAREVQFAADVNRQFTLTDLRVGVAIFGGTTVQPVIRLGQYSSQQEVSQALTSDPPRYLGGATDTDTALKYVNSQDVFGPSSGGRSDAAKFLIVVTDGGSVSAIQAKLTASGLQRSGVQIIAVGVSTPNVQELKDLVKEQVLDVFTGLSIPAAVQTRVQTLANLNDCIPPGIAITDVTDYCKQFFWENGIHPHPFDCSKFIECTYLKTDVMSCPPNEIYDAEIQTCNYPGLVHEKCGIGNTAATQAPRITTPRPCVRGTLDVLFIIDSSDDQGSTRFRDALSFAANVAENFLIGANGVQFSVLTFGTNTNFLFDFSKYGDYKSLQQAILGASFQGGATNTFLGLQEAVNLFTSAHGARSSAPKVAVIISNGRSSDAQRTQQQATALKATGVHVISVGFSTANFPELQAIASSPSEAFPNSNFNGVIQALRTYSNSTCINDGGTSKGDIICNGIQFADVIFVLDSSTSISNKDYQTLLRFVADLTGGFIVGPEDARFAAILFSQDVRLLFNLKDYNSNITLASAILAAERLNGGTETAKALNFVREQQMFSEASGGRINATKVVIILTDGRSNSMEDTLLAARSLKATGVKVVAVGVSDLVNREELEQLATDNSSLYFVNSFDALNSIKTGVTRTVCYLSKDPTGESLDYSTLCAINNWANGVHPNPNDCKTYVVCASLTTTLRYCPAGQVYDPVTALCTSPASAHRCSDPIYFGPTIAPQPVFTSATRGPHLIDGNSLCQLRQLADGIYPHPGYCNQFIECSGFVTTVQNCPDNLNFNTAINVCDDQHVVDCQINFTFFDFKK